MGEKEDLLGDISDEPVTIIRPDEHLVAAYSNLSIKYEDQNADYKQQYCKIYGIRLEKMVGLLRHRIKIKWGTKYPVFKVHKLQEEPNRKCIIIGTLFKDQKLKPSILKKISEQNSLIPQPIYTHFTDDSDQLFIEDDLQRCEVVGNIDLHRLVTGISCALLGTDQGKGKFLVEDCCYPDCQPQVERPITIYEDRFICFISGLDLVNYEKIVLPLKLCIDYLVGYMGHIDYVEKISRLVIVGNSVRIQPEVKKQTSMVAKVVESDKTFNAMKMLDLILSQFVRVMNVDIMPGKHDPSNHLLAQQPMNRCMFPLASKYESLKCVTNPYAFDIEGVKCLGTSGQPVTDITNYSRIEQPIEALEHCLKWSHIAPTAPDTLGCYPYYDKDPLVIEECPHVFFAGNQPEFQSKLYIGPEGQIVRLICIPPFRTTRSIVFFNLRTFECYDMCFGLHKPE